MTGTPAPSTGAPGGAVPLWIDAPQRSTLLDLTEDSWVYPAQFFSFYRLRTVDHDGDALGVAVTVALVVAKFVGDDHVLFAPDHLTNRGLTDVCEDYVERNAGEAEGNTYADTWTAPIVISAVLHDMSLLDDFVRMKSGEQWMAFEDRVDPVERVSRLEGTR